MKTILSWKRHHHIPKVSIFLIIVALVMGIAGARCDTTPIAYTLTISSTDGGSVTTPGEGTFTYDAGTVVNLVATPDAGYRFVRWTGDIGTVGDVYSRATTVVIYGDYEITACFEAAIFNAIGDRAYTLSIGRVPTMVPALLGGGVLGGPPSYVYDRLGLYIDSIREVDSIIFLDTTRYSPDVLREWPEEYSFIFPFEVDALCAIELPFGYFKPDEYGRLRGIIMGNETELINLGVHLTEHKVPVGKPYGLVTEGDIIAEIRYLIQGFWDEDDLNIR